MGNLTKTTAKIRQLYIENGDCLDASSYEVVDLCDTVDALAAALVELQEEYRADEQALHESGMNKRPDTTDYAAEATVILARVKDEVRKAALLEAAGFVDRKGDTQSKITAAGLRRMAEEPPNA